MNEKPTITTGESRTIDHEAVIAGIRDLETDLHLTRVRNLALERELLRETESRFWYFAAGMGCALLALFLPRILQRWADRD